MRCEVARTTPATPNESGEIGTHDADSDNADRASSDGNGSDYYIFYALSFYLRVTALCPIYSIELRIRRKSRAYSSH